MHHSKSSFSLTLSLVRSLSFCLFLTFCCFVYTIKLDEGARLLFTFYTCGILTNCKRIPISVSTSVARTPGICIHFSSLLQSYFQSSFRSQANNTGLYVSKKRETEKILRKKNKLFRKSIEIQRERGRESERGCGKCQSFSFIYDELRG